MYVGSKYTQLKHKEALKVRARAKGSEFKRLVQHNKIIFVSNNNKDIGIVIQFKAISESQSDDWLL